MLSRYAIYFVHVNYYFNNILLSLISKRLEEQRTIFSIFYLINQLAMVCLYLRLSCYFNMHGCPSGISPEGRIGVPLTYLIPPYLCAQHTQGREESPSPYDIDEIVSYHCLRVLFINSSYFQLLGFVRRYDIISIYGFKPAYFVQMSNKCCDVLDTT